MTIRNKFSSRASRMQPAAIRAIVARIQPDFVPFAAGKPAEHLFPLEEIYQQTGQLLEKYGGTALQYSGTAGFAPLREWIAKQAPPATADNVLIISGSQQGIDLMGKVFIDEGDKVVLSAPTYTAAISSLQVYGPAFISVGYDDEGFDPAELEKTLAEQAADIKFIYAIPNFMNPSGIAMTLERRKHLVGLARKHDLLIMEDDPYGQLRFAGEPLPNLYELAPERVVYAGTFSKVIAPGMRVGWLVGPSEIIPKLTIAKQTTDLQVGGYQQTLLYEVVQNIGFDAHIERVRSYYKRQCEVMLAEIEDHFPDVVTYTRPPGGMFIWCRLPEGFNATEILEQAMAHKVAYVPGEAFFANGQGQNCFRLSFSQATEVQIREGIAILGKLFTEIL